MACSDLQGFGYAVSLGAFAWYNYLKMNPAKPAMGYGVLPTKDSDADLQETAKSTRTLSVWRRIFG